MNWERKFTIDWEEMKKKTVESWKGRSHKLIIFLINLWMSSSLLLCISYWLDQEWFLWDIQWCTDFLRGGNTGLHIVDKEPLNFSCCLHNLSSSQGISSICSVYCLFGTSSDNQIDKDQLLHLRSRDMLISCTSCSN